MISEQGPHGPSSPMDQKLSFSPSLTIRDGDTPTAFHSSSASSSSLKMVTQRRRSSRSSVFAQKFPGKGDRLFLEIVAEGEVAQHLEEGVVPQRLAHIAEVVVLAPCPHALLRGRRPRVGPLLKAQKDVLELDHAGIDEEQAGVFFRDKGRAGNNRMAVASKKFQELASRFFRQHGYSFFRP